MTDIPEDLALIPGGEFLMGSDLEGDHNPVHKVRIDTFYMDKYEVTNAKYVQFCQVTGHRLPAFWNREGFRCGLDYPNHPVVGVSWRDAVAYAGWGGERLPTEAEWEYAAGGGLAGMSYPNGETLHPSDGNYTKSGKGGPVAVGSYPPNGFGVYDMQGNVVECILDFYDPNYCASSPSVNPPGPSSGKFRVIRGGSWHSGPYCNKVYDRNAVPPNWADFNVGFRCVKNFNLEKRR